MKKKESSISIFLIVFGILMLCLISYLMFNTKLVAFKPAIRFDQSSFGVNQGESFKIKYDSNNKPVVFENKNEDIIDIDENGVITAKEIGTAEVTACLKDDKKLCDTAKVIVFENKNPITKIIFNHEKEDMFVGNSIVLDVKVEPSNVSSKKLTWESSNPEVAYIEEGIVYAKSLGTSTITAKSNNVSASLVVNVVTEKTISVKFIVQDKKAISKDDYVVNCTVNQDNRECNITPPNFSVNSGYEVVGFSLTPNNSIINAPKNEKINVKNDTNYYIVSRNIKPINASFIIQNDTADIVGSNTRCYFYNGNDTCEVSAPNLVGKNGNRVIGWNTDKNAHEASIKVGDVIKVNDGVKYYSITEKDITVTYDENIDIPNVNIKATRLSFNSNKYTKCTSYNGEGCYITWIPTVYSPGNVIHGFSLTKNGLCIPILQTKFNVDTTLYARIHNDLDGKNVSGYDTSYDGQIGAINVEVEKGVPVNDSIKFVNYLESLYKDHPELFYYNGKIALLTNETYMEYNDFNSAGITWTDDYGFFSTIYIRYLDQELTNNRFLGTTTHELGHAYNNKYNQIFGKHISKQDDVKALYNKYKNYPYNTRPLSDYAYNDKELNEFVSEALLETYRMEKLKSNKEEPYRSEKAEVTVTDDIVEAINKYLKNGKKYFQEVGMLK